MVCPVANISRNKILGTLAAAGLSVGAIFAGSMIVPTYEGLVNKTYLDPVGIATSCYGHTGSDVQIGQVYSNEQCVKQLSDDIQEVDKQVRSVITVPLTWYQEAALISFTYNIGYSKFKTSTLVKLFNAGKYTEGCKQMLRWVYAGGKELPGLVKRRQQETAVCLGDVRSVQ